MAIRSAAKKPCFTANGNIIGIFSGGVCPTYKLPGETDCVKPLFSRKNNTAEMRIDLNPVLI